MTTKLPPGSPKLTIDGEEQPGDDTLSESEWNLPDEQDKIQANLKKIAKERK